MALLAQQDAGPSGSRPRSQAHSSAPKASISSLTACCPPPHLVLAHHKHLVEEGVKGGDQLLGSCQEGGHVHVAGHLRREGQPLGGSAEAAARGEQRQVRGSGGGGIAAGAASGATARQRGVPSTCAAAALYAACSARSSSSSKSSSCSNKAMRTSVNTHTHKRLQDKRQASCTGTEQGNRGSPSATPPCGRRAPTPAPSAPLLRAATGTEAGRGARTCTDQEGSISLPRVRRVGRASAAMT